RPLQETAGLEVGSHQLLDALPQLPIVATGPGDVGQPLVCRGNLDGGAEDAVQAGDLGGHDRAPAIVGSEDSAIFWHGKAHEIRENYSSAPASGCARAANSQARATAQ